jgi:hypothetical protein
VDSTTAALETCLHQELQALLEDALGRLYPPVSTAGA